MTNTYVLDTGPAGKIAHPRPNRDIAIWLQKTLAAGAIVILPEIVDYELRRNFLLEVRRGNTRIGQSLQRLDELRHVLSFLPIDSVTMKRAAAFWAEARGMGKPTADLKELDGDAILAAQAYIAHGVVVTENIGHLGLFVEARHWQEL